MPKLLRITTVPVSLQLLLTGQMKFMREQGYEVVMASADGDAVADVKAGEGCLHHVIPFTRTISPWQDLKCLWQLIQLIRSERPDIVHTHTPKAGLLGMWAAFLCGVPLKMHTIAGLPLMTATGGKRKLLEFIERITYWVSDYVLPNSNSIMVFIQEKNFTSSAKLHMIGNGSSNGIDVNRFSRTAIQQPLLDEIKTKINWQSRCRYILAVGRVVKDKGIVELVTAFLLLQQIHTDLRLVVLGPLEKERAEEQLPAATLSALQTHPAIVHVNWAAEVEYYMYLADVLVHASYREGFPNVLLQGAAMECAVVCSAIPGNIDVITDQETGLYFEVGNASDLEEKLQSVLANPDLMKSYGSTARQVVEKNFSRTFIHQELQTFYEAKLNEET